MKLKSNLFNYVTLILALMTLGITISSYIQDISYSSSYFFSIITLIMYIINRIIIDKETNLSKKDKEMIESIKNKIKKEGEENG